MTNLTTSQTIPEGYCQCGCGEALPPLIRKDRPRRFINGHQNSGGPMYLVDPDTGCWVWQRAITGPKRAQYGVIIRDGKRIRAHRWMYEKMVGPIPEGMQIDHLCKNKMCVNPDHLESVTHAVNIQRGPLAKLTPEIVKEIRANADRISRAEMARQYGTSAAIISYVVHGKTWKGY